MAQAKIRTRQKTQRTLLLNPDKLGLVVATFLATAVMGFCFFYRQADWFETAIRVALIFVMSYVATFIFVVVLKHIASTELAKVRAREREKKTVQEQSASEEASERGEPVSEEVRRGE